VAFDGVTTDGTATAPGDYTARATTRFSIAAGATSRTIAVVVKGDAVAEANETLTLKIANPSGATIADASGTGTIVDDDGGTAPPPTTPPPGLTLAIGDIAQLEGASGTRAMYFNVRLSAASPTPVTFDIATANGTASSASDYYARTLTAQTIPAGATSWSFAVTVRGDTTAEADETFQVRVSNVKGTSVADGVATGTIRNDD
jgi:hypothetical protein